MARVKDFIMDYEENLSILDNLISIYSNDLLDDFLDSSDIIKILFEINSLIRKQSNFIVNTGFLRILFDDEFMSCYHKLKKLCDDLDDPQQINYQIKEKIRSLTEEMKMYLQIINLKLLSHDGAYPKTAKNIYNSEEYYNKQIKNLQNQKKELENVLEDIRNQQSRKENKSHKEIEDYKQQILDKENELNNSIIEIQNLQKELKEKEKQENAIQEWNTKIRNTFSNLTTYLKPIKKEHDRLNILFWIYSSLIAAIIILLIVLECIICYKFSKNLDEMPKWIDYLVIFIPIPLAAGLLWVFISQANRAQRQLVYLAKYIHEIEYIEGLLLSINSLSSNIQNSTERINSAIDKLLENHLKASDRCGNFNEEEIIHEEKKDMIPYDLVIKLLKEMKGIIGK